jgi:UDP-N-acetylmuramoylalanine--D-glutamate ligase
MRKEEKVPEGADVLVVGLARSGFAAAKLLLGKGFRVRVSEAMSDPEISERARVLEEQGALVETGGHTIGVLQGVSLLVSSPGVPDENPLLVAAGESGIPVIDELELASREVRTPIIAVTGTNGKTTTSSLIAHCLAHAGRRAVLAGNIGVPLSAVLEEAGKADWLVLEVSSYQLGRTVAFRPAVSVFLNISSDHMDRYRSFEDYFSHKKRLFANQDRGDTAVLNGEDGSIRALSNGIKARTLFFDRFRSVDEGACMEGGVILQKSGCRREEVCRASEIPLPGGHNLQNVLASVCALSAAGCTPIDMRESLRTFHGLHHRLEDLGTVRGVRFINDSKATNVSSVLVALESFQEPIVLIMGGRHKGEPYSQLGSLVKRKVKHLVVVGEAAPLIVADLSRFAPTTRSANLHDALAVAMQHARAGDVVLLSPACSSFDMFRNYEERGDAFRELVNDLIRREG